MIPDVADAAVRRDPFLTSLLVVSVFLSAAGVRASASPAAGGDSKSPQAIVLRAYQALQDALTKSGTEAKYTITGIETIEASRFDVVRLRDVVTVAPLTRIRVHISTTSFNDQAIAATYSATVERAASRSESEISNPTLAEAFELRKDSGESEPVVAITHYNVTAELLGERLSYRAYLLWLRLPSDSGASFTLNDQVSEGIEEALSEKLPILSKGEVEELLRQKREAFASELIHNGTSENPSCVADQKLYVYPGSSYEDTYHHDSGRHWSHSVPEFQCWCDANCTSIASGRLPVKVCLDNGDVTGIGHQHVGVTRESSEQRGMANATGSEGAMGALGYACAIRDCPAWGCNGQLRIDVVQYPGGTIGFSYQGANLIWDGQHAFAMTCGGCTQVQPHALLPGRPGRGPFHRTTDDGGGGGGTGSNCLRITFMCEPTPAPASACGGQSPCVVESCMLVCWE